MWVTDIGKLNVPENTPIGATVAVISKEIKGTGKYWTCSGYDDTMILSGSSDRYILGGSGLVLLLRMKIGNTWYRSGDILFRGPGKYRVPDQTYEISYVKNSNINPGKTPGMIVSMIKSGNSGTSGTYESFVMSGSFQVTANTCTVGPTSQTVPLKAMDRDLNATGYGPHSQFNFRLSNCAGSISEVVATMIGTPDAADPSVFANAGTAQGIGIEVSNAENGAIVAPNAKEAARWATTNAAGKNYALRARVKKTGTVQAGTIRAVAQVLFNYN
jgi:minor fimbrial subunit